MDKPKYLIVKEDPTFVRDVGSKALLQTDVRKKDDFMRRRNLLKASMANQTDLTARVGVLETKLDSIESLLRQILESKQSNHG